MTWNLSNRCATFTPVKKPKRIAVHRIPPRNGAALGNRNLSGAIRLC